MSEMGLRVMDLQDRQWSVPQIAEHCGCDKNSIRLLLQDPRTDPRHVTGDLLVKLHAAVMRGETDWMHILRTLIGKHGMTFAEIAKRCGVTVNYLRYGFVYNEKKMPRYRLGSALKALYFEMEKENGNFRRD